MRPRPVPSVPSSSPPPAWVDIDLPKAGRIRIIPGSGAHGYKFYRIVSRDDLGTKEAIEIPPPPLPEWVEAVTGLKPSTK